MNSLKELAEKVASLEKELAELKQTRSVEHHHHHYPAPVSYPVYVYPNYWPNTYPHYPVWGSSIICSGNTQLGGSYLGTLSGQCTSGLGSSNNLGEGSCVSRIN